MLLKLTIELVREIAGEMAGKIISFIFGKKNINEYLIAKKLNLTINQVRNILYRLSNFGLVTFARKKDKRKGWYTYYWTFNTYRALEFLQKNIEKEIENLQNQLKSRNTKRFYVCEECKVEVSEEKALGHDFTCRECGQVYNLSESRDIIKNLELNIERLTKRLMNVQDEMEKIKQKEEKAKKRKTGKSGKKTAGKKSKKSAKKKTKSKIHPKKQKQKSKLKKSLKQFKRKKLGKGKRFKQKTKTKK